MHISIWQISIAICTSVKDCEAYFFFVSILRWPLRSIWIIRIDWSIWDLLIFRSHLGNIVLQEDEPLLIINIFIIKNGIFREFVLNQVISHVLESLDTCCCPVFNRFTQFTGQLVTNQVSTGSFINISDAGFLENFTIHNRSVRSWFVRYYTFNICHIILNSWCCCLTRLSWIFFVIVILLSQSTWNIFPIFCHRDNASQFPIGHMFRYRWHIGRDNVKTRFLLVSEIALDNWYRYLRIGITVLVPFD